MEQLLVIREDELKREYDDLVRSRDAAYESIRTINRALADNRAESRRIFRERLVLASASATSSSSRLPTSTSTPARTPVTRSATRARATDPSPSSLSATSQRPVGSSPGKRVRFAADPSPVYPIKLTSFFSQVPAHHYNIWKRIRSENASEAPRSSRFGQPTQSRSSRFDSSSPNYVNNNERTTHVPWNFAIAALAQRNREALQNALENVGNEHSYAVNNEESEISNGNVADEEDNATRDAAPIGAAAARVTVAPSTSRMIGIDLSIVKSEPEEPEQVEIEEAHESNTESKSKSAGSDKEPSAERETALQTRCSSKRCGHSHPSNEFQERLNKKREQTRQRMRRWRERRRMGLLGKKIVCKVERK